MTPLECARWWHAQGYPPIPVAFREKAPKIPDWPDLRLELDELPTHFNNGRQNIGVLLGVDGGTDIDCDCAEAIAAWRELAPPTQCLFGRESARSSHSFYKTNPPLRSVKFLDSLDKKLTLIELRSLKTDGRIGLQTIVPCSTHPSGETVRFERQGTPGVVDGPVLMQAVSHCAAAALLGRHWPGEKGGRHDAFLALAGALAQGKFPLDDAVRLVRGVYRVLWPDPDLAAAEREVETTYRRHDDGHEVTGLNRLAELIDRRVVAQAVRWLKLEPLERPAGTRTPKVKPLEFHSGRVVFEAEDPELEPVVAELIFPGYSLLAARPKIGKSWLALQTAIAVATGTPLAGWLSVPKSLRVVYLALEEPRQRTTARMRKLIAAGDDIAALDNIRFIYKISAMMSGGAAELDAALSEWNAGLVIIDTVRAFSRLRSRSDSNAVQFDYDISSLMREIAEKHRTAIIGVDHTRKMPGDVIDSVIGTTGTTAGCDAVIGMARTPNGDTVLTARGREHEELSYAMRFDTKPGEFGWAIYGRGDDARVSEEREDIAELLRHEGPKSPAQIALLLKKNANTTRRLLSKMVADGKIVKQEKGYVLAGSPTGSART